MKCALSSTRGFTLMEVMIALGILGLSLGVLLAAQSQSLNAAAKARDITIATLLARGKMIDIEQSLFDDGFVEGEQSEKGEFDDEGHPEIKWEYTVKEVELDLGGLGDMCSAFGDFGGGEDSSEGAADCESMFGAFGGMLDAFTARVANSVRAVELTVTWPEGAYKDSLSVNALVSRPDDKLAQAAQDVIQDAQDGDTTGDTGNTGNTGTPQ